MIPQKEVKVMMQNMKNLALIFMFSEVLLAIGIFVAYSMHSL